MPAEEGDEFRGVAYTSMGGTFVEGELIKVTEKGALVRNVGAYQLRGVAFRKSQEY